MKQKEIEIFKTLESQNNERIKRDQKKRNETKRNKPNHNPQMIHKIGIGKSRKLLQLICTNN